MVVGKKAIGYAFAGAVFTVFLIWLFEGRRIVAKVGDFKIYSEDVEYRNRLIKHSYPQEKSTPGYDQLVRAYTKYQIMRNNGYDRIDKRLETELERMEKETRDPSALQRIKEEVFDGKVSVFKRALVIPAAVEEEIYFGFFDGNNSLHKNTQKTTQSYYEEIKSTNKDLKAFAEEKGLIYRKFQISKKFGVLPINIKTNKVDGDFMMEARSRRPDDEMVKYWFEVILKELKPGDLISQPIDNKESWQIGKLVSQKGKDEKVVEVIIVPKRSFSDFIEAEKDRVPVRTGFFLF